MSGEKAGSLITEGKELHTMRVVCVLSYIGWEDFSSLNFAFPNIYSFASYISGMVYNDIQIIRT